MMKRECTIEMKVRTARRWVVKNVGNKYQNLLGFRADEQERVIRNKKRWKKVDQVFPLYNLGITKAAVNNYWLQKPYRLEIPSILGNCTLCFMKGTANVINILRHDPSLAAPWIADEEKSKKHYGHTYLKGITIAECLRIASMPDLFTENDLDQLLPSYNCSCSS
jgi:site-specific DNA-cytosine methylase